MPPSLDDQLDIGPAVWCEYVNMEGLPGFCRVSFLFSRVLGSCRRGFVAILQQKQVLDVTGPCLDT